MNNEAVVLVASRNRVALVEALLDAGLTPLERTGIRETVATLRREPTAAVLVDATGGDVDVLELLLNIRDFSPSVGIGVIGDDKAFEELTPLLRDFEDVLLLPAGAPPAEVVEDFLKNVRF